MRDWWILPWLVDLFFTTERLGFSRGWWICFSQLRDWGFSRGHPERHFNCSSRALGTLYLSTEVLNNHPSVGLSCFIHQSKVLTTMNPSEVIYKL